MTGGSPPVLMSRDRACSVARTVEILSDAWMFLVLRGLGKDYIVWDKAAEIEFVKPGRGTVHAEFRIDDALLDAIRAETADGDKHLRWLPVDVVDSAGDAVARIRKQIYVRRKPGKA